MHWLKTDTDNKIYTINGNAGTGKTTFIHYLQYNDESLQMIILNVSLSKSYVEWFSGIKIIICDIDMV